MAERVTTTIADGIAEVRLSRPDKMNALDKAMFDAIIASGEALMDRGDVRIVLLHGEGKAFCAGLDTANFGSMASREGGPAANPDLVERHYGDSNMYQRVATVWRDLPMPVIASLHGVCLGGGMQIALGADIRIGGRDLRMAMREMNWGIIPDMGGFWLLPQLVGTDVARELIYTARIVEAEEADAMGLVTRLTDDPLADARELAATIAGRNPDAVRTAKTLFAKLPSLDRAETLQAETDGQIAVMKGANVKEAILASMQKRAPDFKDPD